MTALRVYAHHGPIPTGFLVATQPALPVPGLPEPIAEYWCELAPQSTLDTQDYGPAGAVAPDQWRWDLGYAKGTVDFTVTGLCVLLVGAARTDYDFVLVSPTGLRLPVPTGLSAEPMAPMPAWGDPDAPYEGLQLCWAATPVVASGRGPWQIQVFPKLGVETVPTDSAWTNGVSSVTLDGGGFLAVEFTGVDVVSTTTTPRPTTTTTTTTPPPTTTTTTTPPPTTTTTTTPPPTTTTTTPPPTTTTPPPTTTTTTTTTPPPTTTTTTTAPPTTTTTTTTTTAPPLRDQLGCLGTVALLIALVITAAAAVMFFVWACRGYIGVALFATALSLAGAALLLLPGCMLLFRDGSVLAHLRIWFARLSAGTPLLAAVLAILGELNCAGGALIVSGLLGTLLSVLVLSQRIVERRS